MMKGDRSAGKEDGLTGDGRAEGPAPDCDLSKAGRRVIGFYTETARFALDSWADRSVSALRSTARLGVQPPPPREDYVAERTGELRPGVTIEFGVKRRLSLCS